MREKRKECYKIREQKKRDEKIENYKSKRKFLMVDKQRKGSYMNEVGEGEHSRSIGGKMTQKSGLRQNEFSISVVLSIFQ